MEQKNTAANNLLAIAAHQDDIEIMAMDGILKSYGSKKYDFYACIVADFAICDKVGKYAELSDKEMVDVRNAEQIRASEIGEYAGLSMLKHTSKDLEEANNPIIIKELAAKIKEIHPDIIYTHNIFDKRKSHQNVCQCVIAAIKSLPEEDRPKLLYGCEAIRSLDWLSDKYKVVFDLSDNKELQSRLIGVYDSRVEGLRNYTKAVMGRKMANALFNNESNDEDKLVWYGINLTPIIAKDIATKDYCIKIISDSTKELLDNIN